MHEFNDEVEKLAAEILEYSLVRLKLTHRLTVQELGKIYTMKLEIQSRQKA